MICWICATQATKSVPVKKSIVGVEFSADVCSNLNCLLRLSEKLKKLDTVSKKKIIEFIKKKEKKQKS